MAEKRKITESERFVTLFEEQLREKGYQKTVMGHIIVYSKGPISIQRKKEIGQTVDYALAIDGAIRILPDGKEGEGLFAVLPPDVRMAMERAKHNFEY